MDTIDQDMGRAIQNSTRALARSSPHHRRIGPFTVRYNPDWDIPPANYAIPDPDAAPSAADIEALITLFRELGRVPRLEFLPSTAPGAEEALLAAGFTVSNRAPLLACTPDGLRAPEPATGITVIEPSTDAEYAAAAGVQHLAYGGTGEPSAGSVRWLKEASGGGGVTALATADDGTPVGAGGCSVPTDGLSELAGLGVAAAFRRRGIGAAVSAFLTATAFGRGIGTVWLEPGDAAVERIYAGIGYHRVAEKADFILD
ncbi:GNAT family N-acetyltransferase [Streptomyces sp. NPDC055709]